MKVKYLLNDGNLKLDEIYNVFAIQEWNTKEKKIYISDFCNTGGYYISPYDFDFFEIVDTNISKFWEFGLDDFGQITIGIHELLTEKSFFERYYDDDEKIKQIIDLYYKIGKKELFNCN